MRNFKRILFPVAFSPECEKAATDVAYWARRFDAEVIILHVDHTPMMVLEGVVVWEPPSTSASPALINFAVEEFQGVKVQRLLRTGEPATEIIKYVRNEGADLIMMPTHGLGLFRRFVLGSITAKVLHDAPCPVWTSAHVHERDDAAVPNLSSVVCAVDVDEPGVHTLRYAGGFATAMSATLTVAHAVPYVPASPEGNFDQDLRMDLIKFAKERLAEMQVSADTNGTECVGAGNVGEFVAHAARSHKAGLVIIGRGRKGGLGRLRTHDYSIIRESPCPVLSL